VTFLLDTNVVSETRRRAPNANVVAWLRQTDPSALYLSVLTLGEIAKGADLLGRRDPVAGAALMEWLDKLRQSFADRLLPINAEVAETWGRLAAVRPLPVIDGLLAATALTRRMTFVTRNGADVAGTGVRIVDPWAAG